MRNLEYFDLFKELSDLRVKNDKLRDVIKNKDNLFMTREAQVNNVIYNTYLSLKIDLAPSVWSEGAIDVTMTAKVTDKSEMEIRQRVPPDFMDSLMYDDYTANVYAESIAINVKQLLLRAVRQGKKLNTNHYSHLKFRNRG